MVDQQSNLQLSAGSDLTINGDAAGRDRISHTTAGRDVVGRDSITHTTVVQRDPVAFFAVSGLTGVALLLVFALAFVAARDSALPPTLPPTDLPPSATLALTAAPAASPIPPTQTPSPTPTPSPTLTASATASPSPAATSSPTPSLTQTPTESPAPPAATPTLEPTPASTVPVFDSFSDDCLARSLWEIDAAPGEAGAAPGRGQCLNALEQFFAEDQDHLSVFLDADATRDSAEAHGLTALTGGLCYKEVEVVLALQSVGLDPAQAGASYLSAGLDFEQKSGINHLEIRLEGSSLAGDSQYQLAALRNGERLSFPQAYTPGQPVTVAFRVEGNALSAYVDGQAVAGPFAVTAWPCQLTLGYLAEAGTTLQGYFDEVRLSLLAPARLPLP